jgi:hypothetical protein
LDADGYSTDGTCGIYSKDEGLHWQSAGPFMRDAKINMLAAQDTFLFAARDSGVFRMGVNDTLWMPVLVSKKAYSFTVDAKIWVSTDSGGVYQSSDNGAIWSEAGIGLPKTKISILGRNGTNLFAGTDGSGMFMLADGGNSWKPIGLDGKTISAIGTVGSSVLAGTSNGELYVTSNNGISWRQSYWYDQTCHISALAVNGFELLAQSGNDIFLSTDFGRTWGITTRTIQGDTSSNELMKKASDSLSTQVLALCKDGRNLFVGTIWGDVYRSPDSGSRWNFMRNILPGDAVKAIVIIDTMVIVGLDGSGVWRRSLHEMNLFDTPQQLSPANGSSKQPAVLDFRWSTIMGAGRYQFVLTHNGKEIINADTITTPEYSMDLNIFEIDTTLYSWKVRAIGNNDITCWSPQWTFYKKNEAVCMPGKSCILSPMDRDTIAADNAVFTWTYCPLSLHYFMKIAKDSLMDSLVVADSSIEAVGGLTVSKKYETLDTMKNYWWRVDACTKDTCVNCGGNHKITVVAKTGIKNKIVRKAEKWFAINTRGIRFYLPEESALSLRMFDMRGHLVFSLLRARQAPGCFAIPFSSAGLSSGCYVVHFDACNTLVQQKMVLTK